MKKSDIATIILVGTLTTLIAYWIGDSILPNPDEMTENVQTMDMIFAEVMEPNSEVFNPLAINPTVEVYVGLCVDIDGNGTLEDWERKICEQSGEGSEEPEEDE